MATTEERRNYQRQWRENNRERIKLYQEEHKTERNAYRKQYRKYGRRTPFEPKAYDSVTGEEIKL